VNAPSRIVVTTPFLRALAAAEPRFAVYGELADILEEAAREGRLDAVLEEMRAAGINISAA
jgi:hypothetical protein